MLSLSPCSRLHGRPISARAGPLCVPVCLTFLACKVLANGLCATCARASVDERKGADPQHPCGSACCSTSLPAYAELAADARTRLGLRPQANALASVVGFCAGEREITDPSTHLAQTAPSQCCRVW